MLSLNKIFIDLKDNLLCHLQINIIINKNKFKVENNSSQ